MAKVKRDIVVTAIQDLTPHLRRVSFGGDSLANFPEGQESGYIKFAFPPLQPEGRPRMRSYTIRAFDAQAHRLDVDFARHEVGGPATEWANGCQVGDTITMVGPGATKLVDSRADWFFFVGDMTALPAIAVNIERLPATAQGYAVIEILSEEDRIELAEPAGIEIVWVVNPHPEAGTGLIDAVRSKEWRSGVPGVWSACEFGKMKLLRQYFAVERALPPESRYISSYWKLCASDEEHKKAKAEETGASKPAAANQ